MNANHVMIEKNFEEKIFSPMRRVLERQLTKKDLMCVIVQY